MSSLKKINAAIIGATGYVGLDLVNILSNHPKVKIKYLSYFFKSSFNKISSLA